MSTKVCCYINSQNVFEKFLTINYRKAQVSVEKKSKYIEYSFESIPSIQTLSLTTADLF